MDLASLSINDLLSVFNKMHCRSLCRMQRTCRWIGAFTRNYRRYSHQPGNRLRVNLDKSTESFGFMSFVEDQRSFAVDVPALMEHPFTHVEFAADGSSDPSQDHCNEEQRGFLKKVFKRMKWGSTTHVELSVNVHVDVLEVIRSHFVSANFFSDKLPGTVRIHGFHMRTFVEGWHPLPFVEQCVVKSVNINTMISSLRTVTWDWYTKKNNTLAHFETGHWCQAVRQSRQQILKNVTERMFPWLEAAIIPCLPADSIKKTFMEQNDLVNAQWGFLLRRQDGAMARISFMLDEKGEHKGTDEQRFLLHRLIFVPGSH